MANEEKCWFAVYTKSRHEKAVNERLVAKGFTTFLPLITEKKQWSDRIKKVEVPLIKSYIFVKVVPCKLLWVMQTDGVVCIVKIGDKYTKVPDYQIDALRIVLENKLALKPADYYKKGEKVKVKIGLLKDKVGKIEYIKGENKLILSIDAINYAFSTPISMEDVEKIKEE